MSECHLLAESLGAESDFILLDEIDALSPVVHAYRHAVQFVNQRRTEGGERARQSVRLEACELSLCPCLEFCSGAVVGVQCAAFAVAVAHLDALFLLAVGHEADGYEPYLGVCRHAWFQVVACDEVHSLADDYSLALLTVEEYACVECGLSVLGAEEGADALPVKLSEHHCHGVLCLPVGAQALLSHYVQAVGQSLVVDECADGGRAVGFLLCGVLLHDEHLVLAAHHDGLAVRHFAHVAHECLFQFVVVAKEHVHGVAPSERHFARTVPTDVSWQRDGAGVRQRVGVRHDFHLSGVWDGPLAAPCDYDFSCKS